MAPRGTGLWRLCASLILAVVVAGCEMSDNIQAAGERNWEVATEQARRASRPTNTVQMANVRMVDGIWLGDSSLKLDQGEPLPPRLEARDGITVISNREVTLDEIAEQVTSLTGIPVRLNDLLFAGRSVEEEQESRQDGQGKRMVLSYAGPLSGLLEQVSSRFAVYWRYERGIIEIYKYETRTFTIYALPGTSMQIANTIESTAEGEGGEGQPGSTVGIRSETEAELQFWEEVRRAVAQMLPNEGSVEVSPSSGTITVKGPPETLRRVSRYVRDLNSRLSRQVAIDLKVLSVELSDRNARGVNLDLVVDSLDSTGLFGGITTPGVEQQAFPNLGIGGVSILNATTGVFENLNGTDVIIDALSEQGAVNLLTSSAVTTLNGKAAPVQVVTRQNYIAEVERETDETTGAVTISASTDTLVYGFNMQVLPRIMPHGRVMLMLSLSLSELAELEQQAFADGAATIGLPTLNSRNLQQEIVMRSGQTMVLAGFENINEDSTKRGTAAPDFYLFGGSDVSSRTKTVLVVIMTPQVLETPLEPETRVSMR